MSEWFQLSRQEFILATLKTFGQVRRNDLVREFKISTPLASDDPGVRAIAAICDPPEESVQRPATALRAKQDERKI
jgi:hypothetical protein